jgi:hypothetical protein
MTLGNPLFAQSQPKSAQREEFCHGFATVRPRDCRLRRDTSDSCLLEVAILCVISATSVECENEGKTMIDAKEILSPELVLQIEETARTENRRPSGLAPVCRRKILAHIG